MNSSAGWKVILSASMFAEFHPLFNCWTNIGMPVRLSLAVIMAFVSNCLDSEKKRIERGKRPLSDTRLIVALQRVHLRHLGLPRW